MSWCSEGAAWLVPVEGGAELVNTVDSDGGGGKWDGGDEYYKEIMGKNIG